MFILKIFFLRSILLITIFLSSWMKLLTINKVKLTWRHIFKGWMKFYSVKHVWENRVLLWFLFLKIFQVTNLSVENLLQKTCSLYSFLNPNFISFYKLLSFCMLFSLIVKMKLTMVNVSTCNKISVPNLTITCPYERKYHKKERKKKYKNMGLNQINAKQKRTTTQI